MLNRKFDDNKPIFLQVKELIEDQIINGQLQEEDQIPSTNQIVQFYKINHVTVSKGINLLIDAEVIYKKRGVGMFVLQGAREKLIQSRKKVFVEEYVVPLVGEAEKLGITDHELKKLIEEVKGCERI